MKGLDLTASDWLSLASAVSGVVGTLILIAASYAPPPVPPAPSYRNPIGQMRRGSIQGAVGGGGATPGDAFGACQRGLAARSQCLIDRGDVEGARAATDVAWLAKLDELALADDTIVIYGTDNGPHANSWPDGATTPFRSEKNTNWEGAFRVPWLVRWPGTIKPGRVSNEIVSHHDWLPTLLAAAGMPDVMDRLKAGYKIGDTTYKVHIDGFNFLPCLTGQEARGPRPGFFYFSDDGDLLALRYDNWKLVFAEQRTRGTLELWAEPFTRLRVPKLFNLRTDPLEHADVTSNTYYDWLIDHVFLFVPAQTLVGEFLATFKEFPPRQKAASFTIDQVLAKLQEPGAT